ncbi:MAG: stage 0 sporulation family protein [Planctomycetota bacterium]|jgi:cell fate regulator YaaT (PSP1 superfamily)
MDASEALKAVLTHGCTSCRTGCNTTHVPDVKPGDGVVVRTDRGVEYALILTAPEPVATGETPPPFEVLRKATADDEHRQAEIDASGRSTEFRFCRDKVRELGLDMRVVRVEKILGGQRLTFYFMAEGRVDFRDLVRELAREFKMRIELKQIGARDEAKVLGDVSYCGRELCCSSWIREMRPVNMKMAKNQKSTLDPTKISGMCGRLLCCLRYEDDVYTELRKALPRRGARVTIKASGQTGLVLHQEVLASKCVVLLDRGGTVAALGDELDVIAPGEPEA